MLTESTEFSSRNGDYAYGEIFGLACRVAFMIEPKCRNRIPDEMIPKIDKATEIIAEYFGIKLLGEELKDESFKESTQLSLFDLYQNKD